MNEDIRQTAAHIARRLRGDQPPIRDMRGLLDDFGLKLRIVGDPRTSGATYRRGWEAALLYEEEPPTVLLRVLPSEIAKGDDALLSSRQRFSIAHELGHWALRLAQLGAGDAIEEEACDYFACEFLVSMSDIPHFDIQDPHAAMHAAVKVGQRCGVSWPVAARRVVDQIGTAFAATAYGASFSGEESSNTAPIVWLYKSAAGAREGAENKSTIPIRWSTPLPERLTNGWILAKRGQNSATHIIGVRKHS